MPASSRSAAVAPDADREETSGESCCGHIGGSERKMGVVHVMAGAVRLPWAAGWLAALAAVAACQPVSTLLGQLAPLVGIHIASNTTCHFSFHNRAVHARSLHEPPQRQFPRRTSIDNWPPRLTILSTLSSLTLPHLARNVGARSRLAELRLPPPQAVDKSVSVFDSACPQARPHAERA